MDNSSNNNEHQESVLVLNLSAWTEPAIDLDDTTADYVRYGEDNLYPNLLEYLATASTTNQSCINGIKRSIYGKGIAFTSDNENESLKKDKFDAILKPIELRKFILDRIIHGEAAFQVIYKDKKLSKVKHLKMVNLRAGLPDEFGVISKWYYSANWEEEKDVTPYPAFGTTNNSQTEIFVLQPYTANFKAYSLPDYLGALPYAILEDDISDYLINDIKNGFSGTKLINLNNGVPDANSRKQIKREILSEITGARGNRVIVAFNKTADNATTIDDIPLDDAPNHYEFLASEAESKLLIGHKITSPLLLGIKTGNSGLGNNADEIKNAYLLQDNTLIRPYQEEIITDCLLEIFNESDIDIKDDIYFVTISPIEFTDIKIDELSDKDLEEKTGIKKDEVNNVNTNLNNETVDAFNNNLFLDIVKDVLTVKDYLENYNIIDEYPIDDNNTIFDNADEIKTTLKKQSLFDIVVNFISTGKAIPKANSVQDTVLDNGDKILTRYIYKTLRSNTKTGTTRPFCKAMIAADKLYRKEDIDRMSTQSVNPNFGPNGANTYDIFKYKGGVNCSHAWHRVILLKKLDSNEAEQISRDRATQLGYKRVNNPKEVATATYYQPNNGRIN
jgi:hypothetical protein